MQDIEPILPIIALVAAIVALAATLVFIFAQRSVNQGLRDSIRDVKKQADALNRALSEAEETIGTMEEKLDKLEDAQKNATLALADARKAATAAAFVPTRTAEPKPVVTDEMRYREFIAAYNDFRASLDALGLNAVKAQDAFYAKWHVRGLSCTNYEARMSDPALAPVFAAQESARDAQYLAYPLADDRYAVVPNAGDYTDGLHAQAGGKEAFRSNYDGRTAENLIVLRPAIFSPVNVIAEPGELRLG